MANTPINVLSIAALLEVSTAEVELSPGKILKVRPLNLQEMIQLLIQNQQAFLAMYSSAVGGNEGQINLSPVLLAAPEMVAEVIALASDQEDTAHAAAIIQKQMPATVQLIALERIWTLSVPDPKKTFALLSGVMAQLRRLAPAPKAETPLTPSPIS